MEHCFNLRPFRFTFLRSSIYEAEKSTALTLECPSLFDWACVDDLKAMVGNSPRRYLTQLSKFSFGTWTSYHVNKSEAVLSQLANIKKL
jgi:hypothetical protein